jgi:hypothetical protein
MRRDDPTCTLLKAVDEDTGDIIAFAKWNVYKTPEAVASSPLRPVPSGPGVNEEACKAFFGGLVQRKQVIMGTKPHICTCGLGSSAVEADQCRSAHAAYGSQASETGCCKRINTVGYSEGG